MQPTTTRRVFLGLCGSAALAALPLSASADAAKLDVADPTATALGYVENVSSLKAADATAAGVKPGSVCSNCALYAKAQEKAGYAPCGAFGGRLVAAKGWCKAYAPA